MRARGLVITLAVVLSVGSLIGIGFAGHHLLLSRQQNNYDAGHSGYLRGDCRSAIPQLRAADNHRLDSVMAERARREIKACEGLLVVRDRAAKATPEMAMRLYVAYLIGKPDNPMVTSGRQEARTLLAASVKEPLTSLYYCRHVQDLESIEVLRISPQDELAAPLLAACGRSYAREGSWNDARAAFTRVQRELPTTREAGDTIGELAKAISVSAPPSYWGVLEPVVGRRAAVPLAGRARLVLTNASPWNVEFSSTGTQALFAGVPECSECRVLTEGQRPTCDQGGEPVVLTLPAGKYTARLQYFAPDKPDGPTYLSEGVWNLKADQEYDQCFWVTE